VGTWVGGGRGVIPSGGGRLVVGAYDGVKKEKLLARVEHWAGGRQNST
jgi:hypothetical protein